jgi:glycosyltransferase involved in cell wall biosynthesis
VDNVLVATFAKREARKMSAYEAEVLREFDLVAAISPVDQAHFQKISDGKARVICVTAGVDTEVLQFSEAEQTPGEVVFVGSFDWQPNVDGAIWLVNKVWPKVVERYPDAHLSLVGRNPSEPLKALASDTVTVTGSVPSVTEYIEKASLCAVPLWIGSGMRLKILEAFALGRAVISTSLGAEGIAYTDGQDIVISDKAEEFADEMVSLLKNPDRCRELAISARKLVEEKYSWEQVTRDFREEISGIMKSR